jgi:alpha-beta hydrolase superfamily lysophospholipase
VTDTFRASLLLALVAALSEVALSQARANPALPAPTGSYPVGTRTFDWLDRSRHEKASNDSNQFRQVIVQAWYPARVSSRNPTAPYVPRLNSYRQVWDKAAFYAAAHAQTHSHRNAPAVPGRRAPIVLLSHGWEETRTSYTSLVEDLASRGFAVFGVDHPYMGRIALPNGQVTPAREDQFQSPAEIMDYYGRDLRFVIDQIANLDRDDSILVHSLDLSRIAAIGHSSGFSAVSNACSHDPRIQACVNLDAPGFTATLLKGLTQPLLWIRLERAGPLPPEFLSARSAAVYDLQINGGAHDSVEDWNYLGATSSQERDHAAKLLDLLRSYIAAFLQKSLQGQDSALLRNSRTTAVTLTCHPAK